MSETNWTEVNEWFLQAMSLPEDARRAFLKDACNSELLRREVEALLEVEASAGGFLAKPLFEDEFPDTFSPGSVIGAYRILKPIGRGGMAVVYLAERADGSFKKTVAIKFLSTILPGKFMKARFRQERQVLAQLDHPNIAKLLDGGITKDGVPFLVMEYVKGIPIDRFCEQQGLTLSQRLTLFKKVCAAVHNIHQHLVVHRDIKPANILVNESGEPKILDFGIAKLLNSRGHAASQTTQLLSQPMMTPAFASPEQIRRAQVTTSADIYGLGVLLFKLLTGAQPYQVNNLSPAALERVVCEKAPPRPSLIAKQAFQEAPSGEALSWQRKLPKDLDDIVLKAMRIDPKHRYASALGLSDDLERYTLGFPVTARKGKLGYRMSKFVVRHGRALLAAGLFILVVGFGLFAVGLQRAKTTTAKELSYQLNQFLLTIFDAANPMNPGPKNPTAKELMARANQALEPALADRPEIKAAVLNSLGVLNFRIGTYEQAKEFLEEAYLWRVKNLKPKDADLLETAAHLARFRLFTGDFEGVEDLFQSTLNLKDQKIEAKTEQFIDIQLLKVDFSQKRGRFQQALEDLRTVRPHIEKQNLPLVLANMHGEFGTILSKLGQHDKASRHFEKALLYSESELGTEHPLVAKALNNLAATYGQNGQYELAKESLSRALAIAESRFGANHPYAAFALHNLALAHSRTGEFDLAETGFKRAIAIRKQALGANHPGVGQSQLALARMLIAKGDIAKAKPFLNECLAGFESKPGSGVLAQARARFLLARVLMAEGEFKKAEILLENGYEVFSNELGTCHPEAEAALALLADVP